MPSLSGRFVVKQVKQKGDHSFVVVDAQSGYEIWQLYGQKMAETVALFLEKQLQAGQTKLVVAGPPDFTSRSRHCAICGIPEWNAQCKCPGQPAARRRLKGELAAIDHALIELLEQAQTASPRGLEPGFFASRLLLPASVCRQRLRSLAERGYLSGYTGSMYSWGAVKSSRYTLTAAGSAALKNGLV